MMATRQGTLEKWIRQAERAGWRTVKGRKHWRLYPSDRSQPPMTVAVSPGASTLRNVRADFARRGLTGLDL